MDDFLSLLEKWHQEDQYQKIIDCLETLSNTQALDYALTCQLARAYNNLADPKQEEGHSRLERAAELLRSVEAEGRDDPLWHYRLGYALFYLDREEEALSCFQRALELDPEDEDAEYFIRECKKYIAAKECHPEMYTQEQWDAVEKHLERYFGHCGNVFHEIVSPDIHVDIYIMNPTPERNYYVLSTFGMGAHRMNVPEELADRKLERAEIIVTLPPDWQIENGDERWYWPIHWLKILARLPIQEEGWLGWGHTISNPNDAPFADNTKLCSVMLVQPGAFGREAARCPLPDGDEVCFYQMLPLYFEETQFKMSNSAEALLDRFRFNSELLEVVNLDRPNVCTDRPPKPFAIPMENLKPLYDGDGPQGCIATDRIVVDGCKVGWCYRKKPAPGDAAWDSGWRFAAGDEGRTDDPDRSGVYALNTICNYDPEIIPLLDSEPGTAWSRGEDGVFRPELYQED